MYRTASLPFLLLASAVAQDHLFPLGFANQGGPPPANVPVARIKDADLDGVATVPGELHAFLTTCFHSTGGTCFMTDGDVAIEDGEPVFYFTDSEEGRVVRGRDANHNGVLDPSEVTEFFFFGVRVGQTNLFAPDTLGVHRDPASNLTRVYVALDNVSNLGYGRGIHRLIDLNGDGDAKDPGEQSLFVSGSMGLTVPGNSGPVAITRDFWRQVRVLPGGKVIAFAQGAVLTGVVDPVTGLVVYTVQPEMNAFYGFTDNNGTAVPEVWFDASTLNDLPDHPDFQNGTFPNWDIQYIGSNQRANYARFVNVAPSAGPGGVPVYYIGSSYRTINEGDFNLNGQQIGGLFYRVVDANSNQVIDPGELSLFGNISGSTHAGVAPVGFTNLINGLTISAMSNSTWGMDAADDGSLSFLFDNNSTNDAVVTMRDGNGNGVVEASEIAMVYATTQPGGIYPYPFNSTNGPFLNNMVSLADGTLPGPFPAGISSIGDGCLSPRRGLRPVMDAWFGAPQVGNLQFAVGPIRMIPQVPAFVLADFNPAPAPLPLQAFGLAAGCFSYLPSPVTVGFVLSDTAGRGPLTVPVPNAAFLIGLQLLFQSAVFDPTGSAPVPYYTTNALRVLVQP